MLFFSNCVIFPNFIATKKFPKRSEKALKTVEILKDMIYVGNRNNCPLSGQFWGSLVIKKRVKNAFFVRQGKP